MVCSQLCSGIRAAEQGRLPFSLCAGQLMCTKLALVLVTGILWMRLAARKCSICGTISFLILNTLVSVPSRSYLPTIM